MNVSICKKAWVTENVPWDLFNSGIRSDPAMYMNPPIIDNVKPNYFLKGGKNVVKMKLKNKC